MAQFQHSQLWGTYWCGQMGVPKPNAFVPAAVAIAGALTTSSNERNTSNSFTHRPSLSSNYSAVASSQELILLASLQLDACT